MLIQAFIGNVLTHGYTIAELKIMYPEARLNNGYDAILTLADMIIRQWSLPDTTFSINHGPMITLDEAITNQ